VPLQSKLRWKDIYREAELYKSAVRVYTKPLFSWRKALFTSTDGRTLYDMAAQGTASLDRTHRELRRERFQFRPSVALHHNFNGKQRTLYIAPWEERIVDLLLYRLLTSRLDPWFSPNSYAYREKTYGLDRCQTRIAQVLRARTGPLYAVKRDISRYFDSIDHKLLLSDLRTLIAEDDYLFQLVAQRVRFDYLKDGVAHRAIMGVPFGTATACLLANIYLTKFDRQIENIVGVRFFRYADDLLVLTESLDAAEEARQRIQEALAERKLQTKASHEIDAVLAGSTTRTFIAARSLRHLGLQFGENGIVGLSRDKSRKIQNLFRYAFRRSQRRWQREADPHRRAQMLAEVARQTIQHGVRNVAIIDYYLKHVDDEQRLREIDRWLAEEVLSHVFGGHRKSNFRRIGFTDLRALGLPSLLHRRRMILGGKIQSPFFIWQQEKAQRAFRGTVARL
jgi:hypothetical protein